MTKSISKDLKEIAARHAINNEKRIEEILVAMPVPNTDKPTEEQVRGFEKVCSLIQGGKQINEAINAVCEEAKNEKTHKDTQVNDSTDPSESLQTENSNAKVEDFILSLANQSADATFASLPSIAIEEHQRLKALFVQQYRQRIMERLQDPEFRQQFQAAIEGQDMGKLPLLNSTTSNIALLSSSSSSS